MKSLEFPTTAGDIAHWLGAKVVGCPEVSVTELGSLDNAGPGVLSFLEDRKHVSTLRRLKDAVVLTSEELMDSQAGITFIVVSEPKKHFAQIAESFKRKPNWEGIEPSSQIHPSAKIGTQVRIGAFAKIGPHVVIGDGTTIYAHSFIGSNVIIGRDCEIHPFVTLWDHVQIGNLVKIFSGTVIGSDGFGFFEKDGRHHEMPQIGKVRIEDDVRIGANCTIDRATLGETVIARGTKIDNLVHVGHNTRVGKNVLLCAQVGLSGSVVIEDSAALGGQVGIGDGVTVGSRARMGGQSGSSTNVAGDATYFLTPATPIRETVKIVKYLRKLPEIWERLKKLEERAPT